MKEERTENLPEQTLVCKTKCGLSYGETARFALLLSDIDMRMSARAALLQNIEGTVCEDMRRESPAACE